MNRELVAGVVTLVAGLVGYVVGTAVSYPGRAFSVTAVMVGLLLVATGRVSHDGDPT
ncbi:hypothetical protein [Halorientalis litorea]|jgi:hypothetical protein|uniref:hypothetical protein n=1 Tax=Halorientalis litorea TaxID=2931977 RepID=UPI001FF32AA7|nr:hypothetical protein [Halorientalis litorea]